MKTEMTRCIALSITHNAQMSKVKRYYINLFIYMLLIIYYVYHNKVAITDAGC